MYVYLLPGSELHDKLREWVTTIDDSLEKIVFACTSDIPAEVLDYDNIGVDSMNTSNIVASLSEDQKVLYVHSNYDIRSKDCQMMFYRMSNLKEVVFNNFNTDECLSMRRMFMGCTALESVDMCTLTSDNVEDFTEMFSGCTSCKYLDVRSLSVPSSHETCVYSDMFKNMTLLRRVHVGNTFAFSSVMQLPVPDAAYIPETNGRWNDPTRSTSYTSDNLPSNLDATYFAVDIQNVGNNYLITCEGLKNAATELCRQLLSSIKYYSK